MFVGSPCRFLPLYDNPDRLGAASPSLSGVPATFAEVAAHYSRRKGQHRFLAPLIERIGPMLLREINQVVIDGLVRDVHPNASRGTQVRQVITPISAVLRFAAELGLCEPRRIRRPTQPKRTRLRWLCPTEALRLAGCCAEHFRPVFLLMLMTTCTASEAIYVDWQQVHRDGAEVTFSEDRVAERRGSRQNTKRLLVVHGSILNGNTQKYLPTASSLQEVGSFASRQLSLLTNR